MTTPVVLILVLALSAWGNFSAGEWHNILAAFSNLILIAGLSYGMGYSKGKKKGVKP
jgi:hypothetical protein